MEKIEQFNEERSKEYGKKEQCLQDQLRNFLNKLSTRYEVEEVTPGKEEDCRSNGIEELNFDSSLVICKYISERKEKIKILTGYVDNCDPEKLPHMYADVLNGMGEDFDEILEKYREKRKDREEQLNGFVNSFFKILKEHLFAGVIEPVRKYIKNEGENSEYKEFSKLIDEYLLDCGFRKHEIEVGDLHDTKIAKTSVVVSTDDKRLHKRVKEIIWQPYYLKCYSSYDGKDVDKIFKGNVICYSNKK